MHKRGCPLGSGRRHSGKKGSRIWEILPLVGMALGLVMLLYPLVSDWVATYRDRQAVSKMESAYSESESPKAKQQLHQADVYNSALAGQKVSEKVLPYDQQLALTHPYMSYVECPKINLQMPVYHGVSQESLSAGVGHVSSTSLPVGGTSSNCVVSAHSGMPDMRAFDDIRELRKGDLFALETLGRECVYEVDSIKVISQDDTDAWEEAIAIVPGKDTCLLVTCTPYGVNDHRLLVRGHRTSRKLDRDAGAGNLGNYVNRRTLPAMLGVAGLAAALAIGAHVGRRKAKRRAPSRRAPATATPARHARRFS